MVTISEKDVRDPESRRLLAQMIESMAQPTHNARLVLSAYRLGRIDGALEQAQGTIRSLTDLVSGSLNGHAKPKSAEQEDVDGRPNEHR